MTAAPIILSEAKADQLRQELTDLADEYRATVARRVSGGGSIQFGPPRTAASAFVLTCTRGRIHALSVAEELRAEIAVWSRLSKKAKTQWRRCSGFRSPHLLLQLCDGADL